jgi:hypothetical protein
VVALVTNLKVVVVAVVAAVVVVAVVVAVEIVAVIVAVLCSAKTKSAERERSYFLGYLERLNEQMNKNEWSAT